MLTNRKPQIEKYFEPLAQSLSKVNPNILTLLGSIPPLLFFVFVLTHHYVLAIITFLGTFFDLIDGMVARKYNKVTSFGGFLDSTMDRVSNFIVITAFSFGGIVRWEISAPLLLLAFLTSYIRAQGGLRSEEGADFASGIGLIEHSERMILIISSLFLYILFPQVSIWGFNVAECGFILLAILSLYTVFQRVMHAYREL